MAWLIILLLYGSIRTRTLSLWLELPPGSRVAVSSLPPLSSASSDKSQLDSGASPRLYLQTHYAQLSAVENVTSTFLANALGKLAIPSNHSSTTPTANTSSMQMSGSLREVNDAVLVSMGIHASTMNNNTASANAGCSNRADCRDGPRSVSSDETLQSIWSSFSSLADALNKTGIAFSSLQRLNDTKTNTEQHPLGTTLTATAGDEPLSATATSSPLLEENTSGVPGVIDRVTSSSAPAVSESVVTSTSPPPSQPTPTPQPTTTAASAPSPSSPIPLPLSSPCFSSSCSSSSSSTALSARELVVRELSVSLNSVLFVADSLFALQGVIRLRSAQLSWYRLRMLQQRSWETASRKRMNSAADSQGRSTATASSGSFISSPSTSSFSSTAPTQAVIEPVAPVSSSNDGDLSGSPPTPPLPSFLTVSVSATKPVLPPPSFLPTSSLLLTTNAASVQPALPSSQRDRGGGRGEHVAIPTLTEPGEENDANDASSSCNACSHWCCDRMGLLLQDNALQMDTLALQLGETICEEGYRLNMLLLSPYSLKQVRSTELPP